MVFSPAPVVLYGKCLEDLLTTVPQEIFYDC